MPDAKIVSDSCATLQESGLGASSCHGDGVARAARI